CLSRCAALLALPSFPTRRSSDLSSFEELSDFPGAGETLDDLERPDRRVARIAVAEDLRETVLRCHDYLYGNQAMTAPRAFGELRSEEHTSNSSHQIISYAVFCLK